MTRHSLIVLLAPVVLAASAALSRAPAKKIILHGITFDPAAAIQSESTPVLDEAVEMLRSEHDVAVIVQDSETEAGQDVELLRQRADSVRTYLETGGIAPERVTTVDLPAPCPPSTEQIDDNLRAPCVELHVD